MKPYFVLVLGLLLFSACNNEDEANTFEYPVVYTFTGFEEGTPSYYVVNEEGYETAIPSVPFENFVEFVYADLAEAFETFAYIEEIVLQDETNAEMLLYVSEDNTQLFTDLTYEVVDGQILLSNDGQLFDIAFEGQVGDAQITACEVTFGNTFFSNFSQRIEYSALNSQICEELESTEDFVQTGIDHQNAVAGDTMVVINGQFVWEME